MDKNTITGLVLIVAIMIGFTWLTKPSDEELEAERQKQEQTAAEALRAAQTENEAAAFAASDSAALAAAVFESGAAADNGSYSFSNDNLRLTVDSVAGLSGVYIDESGEIDILDLIANRASVTGVRIPPPGLRCIRPVRDRQSSVFWGQVLVCSRKCLFRAGLLTSETAHFRAGRRRGPRYSRGSFRCLPEDHVQ